MSGGVDSAVAALLERERGAEVVGITVKLWADPETDGAKACCSPEAVLGARAVAHSLGIPHLTLDLEEEFRRRVVGSFLSGYAAGATPEPLHPLQRRGADRGDARPRRAARRHPPGHRPLRAHRRGRRRAAARRRPPTRPRTRATCSRRCRRSCSAGSRFPLTELTKPEVREIAARHGLAVAKKPESQDLCFLAGQGKSRFLRRHGGLRERRGAVLDRSGRQLGRHRGHHNFTVGQRRGIGVSAPSALYVLATDADANTVTVGTREELATHRVDLRDAVLHRDGARVDAVRLRYHSRALPATIGARAPAATSALRSSWARSSPPPAPARPRSCSPARRSSATARSPRSERPGRATPDSA